MADLQTNFNTAPFFDDYDEDKQFYRVLFRPSIPAQARELTQAQTILQKQIDRFGTWAFRNGDIVSGCSIADLPSLPFVRLGDFASNGSSNTINYTANSLVNTYVTSSVSNLTARVISSNDGLVSNYPDTNVIYLQYLNTGINQETNFGNSELLYFTQVSSSGNTPLANIYSISNTTSNTFAYGNAHGITVSRGVIFINGVFVLVEDPTVGIVNAYSTDAGNNVVGFQLEEDIITESIDESLFDNSLGYPNYNAPGAWRLKLTPYLISVDPTVQTSNNFNPIAVYNTNSLILKTSSANNLQSQIGDAVAATVYDEAGNYVVNPFLVDTISKTGNSTFMQGRVQPGLGYVKGYKVDLLKTAYIDVRRGTDTQINKSAQITINYGSYITLNEVAGNFDFDSYKTVSLYDTPQTAVTKHNWASLNPVGNAIGTAIIKEFEYNFGTPGSNTATYNLYLDNIQLNSGFSFSNVNSVYFSNGGSVGVGDLAISGLSQSQNGLQLYGFGQNGLFTLSDQNNNINTQYTYRKKASGLTLTPSGNINITISSSPPGGTDKLPYGIGILPSVDVLEDIIVMAVSNSTMTITNNLIAVNNTSNAVIGSSTTFLNDVSLGESILVGNDIRIVTGISNNTYMNVDVPFSAPNNAITYSKYLGAGSYLQIPGSDVTGTKRVNVINSTSMTINTGFVPANTTLVNVYYKILRTNTTALTKTINKNRFVLIDTTVNPKGPWCLGLADVHNVSKVYGSASNNYTINGIDITNQFLLDNGQRDSTYELASLYPKIGTSPSSTPYLTVQLDYFAHSGNNSGFFSVDSYSIDDQNTSNTNAITTANIPMYVSSMGQQMPLRDYVDFRAKKRNTAANTGPVDFSNSASVSAAIALASYNPSNVGVFYGTPLTPAVGDNFQSDYRFYLSRKDLFYISTSGNLKVKEGSPSTAPQTPLAPDSGMPVAVLNIPPFPSLTTDQLDNVTKQNQAAIALDRECSNPVLVSLITNRRYTMKDIGTLDTRITNLENLMSLNLLETAASQLTITDSSGGNAFKNGIFADPFTSTALGDISNQEYRIAIDTQNAVARPFINRQSMPLQFSNTASSAQKTGRAITLPYNIVTLISQPYATEYTSAASLAFKWNGTCYLCPSYTNGKDTINTGSVNTTLDNATAWQQFAASPFGVIYGDWNTTTAVNKSTVTTGKINTNVIYKNITFPTDMNANGRAYISSVTGIPASQIVIGSYTTYHA